MGVRFFSKFVEMQLMAYLHWPKTLGSEVIVVSTCYGFEFKKYKGAQVFAQYEYTKKEVERLLQHFWFCSFSTRLSVYVRGQ